jgi:hypothetical protein
LRRTDCKRNPRKAESALPAFSDTSLGPFFRLESDFAGGALAQQAASAGVPAALMSATIKAASLFAAGHAAAMGIVSTNAVTLARGVLRAMPLSIIGTVSAPLVLAAVIPGLGKSWIKGTLIAE